MEKITLIINYTIKKEDLLSLLDSASRGADYWCKSDLQFESVAQEAMTMTGIKVTDFEEGKTHTLNIQKIRDGLRAMAEKYHTHFNQFLAEEADNNTGDVLLQCALFGEVIYG